MYENLYGPGRPIIRRKRPFCVHAGCHVEKTFWARSAEEAEDDFYEACGVVEDCFPEIVLEVTDVYEESE